MFEFNDSFFLHQNIKKQAKEESKQSENMPNASIEYEDTPASQKMSASKKARIELECRKELKHFFQLKNNRNDENRLRNVKNWLLTLLSLFKDHRNEQKLRNEIYSLDLRFAYIYSEQQNWVHQNVIKDGLPLIFILTIHAPSPLKRQTFDFELLTFNGKNIYRKIQFDNWQIIFSQLNQMRLRSDKLVYFVEGRQNSQSYISQNKEFTIMLQHFIDLQNANKEGLTESLQRNPVNPIKESQAKLIQRVLKHYQYVKSSLIHQFGWLNLIITPTKKQLIIIVNNLIASMPSLDDNRGLLERIKPYKWAVIKAIRKCLKWDLISSYNQHFPASLENAQSCWMCKKRVYIYCPSCTQNQGKRTSLCIRCYETYHRELTQREEGNQATVEEWKILDAKVEAMLWPPFRR